MPQCASCQFQNMPGTAYCGRCGASLHLATAMINVHPPRASQWAKTWRKTTLWHLWYSSRQSTADIGRQLDVQSLNVRSVLLTAIQLMVPGWPQYAAGRLTLSRYLFAAYVGFWLLTIATYGLVLSTLFIAGLITVHSVSVYTVAHSGTKVRGARIARALLGFGLVGLVFYLPLFRAADRYFSPLVIEQTRGALMRGDVLLANRNAYLSTRPRVGDVVLYLINPGRIDGFAMGRAAVVNLTGQRIDRILAGPGQSVVWDGKTLQVDGQPSTWRPINADFVGLPITVVVPDTHYFILPSGDGVDGAITNVTELSRAFSLVPASSIQGRVYWRHQPWGRMGTIR